MAVTVNWSTGLISIPKADLTLVSGTLYELDTDAFRLELRALEASEPGLPWPRTHDHNTTYTVAGVTYARKVEIINGYTVEFEDGQYSVRLVGSNNNIFDVENNVLVQNQVQIIANNSAGLIEVGTSGLTAAESAKLNTIHGELSEIEASLSHKQVIRLIAAAVQGKLTYVNNGDGTYTAMFRDIADTKDRLTIAGDTDGGRDSVTRDAG